VQGGPGIGRRAGPGDRVAEVAQQMVAGHRPQQLFGPGPEAVQHILHARLVAEQLGPEALLHLEHRRRHLFEHLRRDPMNLFGPRVGVPVEVEQHQLVQCLAPEDDHRFDVPGSDTHRLMHRRSRRRTTAIQREQRGALQ